MLMMPPPQYRNSRHRDDFGKRPKHDTVEAAIGNLDDAVASLPERFGPFSQISDGFK